MRRILFSLSFFLLFLLFIADAKAAYAGDPIRKLGRGVANCATSWVELPKEMMRQTQKSGPVAGIIVAPLVGSAKVVGRTLAGVYEVGTFLIPLPRRYEPLIEPEYVL